MNNNVLLDIIKKNYRRNNVSIDDNCTNRNCNGYQNISIGSFCLNNNELSHNNTAVGFKSLLNSKGKYNTAIGALSAQTLVNGEKNNYSF